MSGLDDKGDRLNLVNLEYHQSAEERYPNLVLKFVCLKDLDDMEPINIIGVDGGKGGADVTELNIYKTPFVVNGQLATVSLTLGEGVACNTIFSN